MNKPFAPTFRRSILLALCVLPLLTQAASTKEAPLDLSIIEQRDVLRPYMTSQQRITYIKAAELIKKGQSDIRSGENLKTTKASRLDPNRDLKPIHERGERLVEEGQATVLEGQKKLVELLTSVQVAMTAHQAIVAKQYNFELSEKDYQAALETAAEETLDNCRDAGYRNIFFDGLRIITEEGSAEPSPQVHNDSYDTFIEVDGTQFSVKLPLGLKLAVDDSTSEHTFTYENESVFEGEKVALLAIELIAPGSGTEALLSVRALDIDSQQLISSVLFYIADASEVLAPETEAEVVASTSEVAEVVEEATDEEATTVDNTTTVIIEAARTIPASVTINDSNQMIEKLSGLATPHTFQTVTTGDTSAQSILVASLLKDTLLKNSTLLLSEGNFIQRSYLPADVDSDAFLNAATATFEITPEADSYKITAKAHESGRVVEIGTLTLNLPE